MTFPSRHIALWGSLSCCGLLYGQNPSAHLVTTKSYGNYANEGSQSVTNGWPANSRIVSGISSVAASTANVAAETVVNLQPSGTSVSATVSEQGGGWAVAGAMDLGTTLSTAGPNAPDSHPHALLMTIRGVGGQRGKLEVWVGGDVTSGAEAGVWIDMADDGSDDFAHIVTPGGSFDRRQWDIHLDGNGEFLVGIRTHARARRPFGLLASYLSGVTVRFTPGHFTAIASDGPQCGARLTAYDSRLTGSHGVTLELGVAPAALPGLHVLGTQRLSVPIIGSRCSLLTDPAVLVPITTDARGEAYTSLLIPSALTRFDVRVQSLIWTPLGVMASNATWIALSP